MSERMNPIANTQIQAESRTTNRVRCHIARVQHRRGKAVPEPVVSSRTLPDFLCARVRTIVAKWREETVMVRELRRLVAAEDLPGIALWYAAETEPMAASIPKAFAGKELNEADDAIFAAGAVPDRDVDRGNANVFQRLGSAWSEMLMRADVPIGPMMLLGIGAAIILLYRPFTPSVINFAIVAALLLVVIARQVARPAWYLHERGVELRRWWRRDSQPDVLVPRTTVLIMRRNALGWSAALHTERRVYDRTLTARECRVLLAWWGGGRGD